MKHTKRIFSLALALALMLALASPAGASDFFPTGQRPDFVRPCLMRIHYEVISLVTGGLLQTSYLILYDGQLVHERYIRGRGPEDTHPLHSVTKSFTSALVGIAIGEGYIDSVNQRVIDFFPDAVIPPGQEDLGEMTIRQVMIMQAGFPALGRRDALAWMDAEDAALAALMTPRRGGLDDGFTYDGGAGMQVLVGIVERAAGRCFYDFAQEMLFGLLGITSATWERAGNGSPIGGFGLHMTPRDMLRFGYLYLRDGVWEGERILPEGWVEASRPNNINPFSYGLMWWGNFRIGRFGRTYEARGLAGQFITIFPERDLVVVRTSRGLFG